MATTKVVDASAIAAVGFVEPEAAAVIPRLQGVLLVAPSLIRYELASICLTKLRRDPAHEQTILARYAKLRSTRIGIQEVDLPACIDLAKRASLSIYDASYLWLARSLHTELVTLDKKLARAASTP